MAVYQTQGLRAYDVNPQPVTEAEYNDVFNTSNVNRGFRQSLLSHDAGAAATEAVKAAQVGNVGLAEKMKQEAYALEQRAQDNAPRVQSVGDIHGVGGFGDWAGGLLGGLPVGAGIPMAAGLAAGVIGRRFGPVGSEVGAMLGNVGGMALPGTDAAVLRQLHEQDAGAPAATPDEIMSRGRAQGWTEAAPFALAPGASLARSTLGHGAEVAAKDVAHGLFPRIAKEAAMGGGTMAASRAIGQQFENARDPNRDTSGDAMQLIDAGAGGAVLGLPFGAAGHVMDVAHSAAGGGYDLGKQGYGLGKRSAGAARDFAGEHLPPAVDAMRETAQDIGDTYNATRDDALAAGDNGISARMQGVGAAAGEQAGRVASALTPSNDTKAAMAERLAELKKGLGILHNPGDDVTAQAAGRDVVAGAAELVKMAGLEGEDAQTVHSLSQKSGLDVSSQVALEEAAHNVSQIAPVKMGFEDFLNDEPKSKSDDSALLSRQTRPHTSAMNDAMHRAGVEEPTNHPELFHEEVGNLVDRMMEGHVAARDKSVREKAKQAFVKVFDSMAQGEKTDTGISYNARARAFAQFVTGTFGEKGNTALTDLVDLAKLRYGDKSAQAGRVGYMHEATRSVHEVSSTLRPLLKDGVVKDAVLKDGVVVKRGDTATTVLNDMLTDLHNAEHRDAQRPRKNDVQAVLDEADRYQAAGDHDAAMKLRKMASDMNNTKGGVKELPGLWADRINPGKFDSVMAVLQAYKNHPERLNKPTKDVFAEKAGGGVRLADTKGSAATAANHVSEEGENLNAPHAKETSGDDAEELRVKSEGETGTHNEASPAPMFHGAGALREGGHKGGVQAPLSRHPSVDYPDSMYNEAVREAHAKYGHRVVEAGWVGMDKWAEEQAALTGKSKNALLDEAMEKVLEHDQERLKKLMELERSGKNVTEDVRWIENRKEMAAELKVRQQNNPSFSVGENFFRVDTNSPTGGANRSYGYYRMENSDGANLKLTGETLSRVYAPREGELRGAYTARVRQREGSKLSKSVYDRSLVDVHMADGTTRPVDIAKLVSDSMRRHQAGDVEGVENNARSNRAGAQGEHESVQSGDFSKGLLSAVHNVLGAIIDAKGVDGKRAPVLAKDTVIYRDATDGRNITYGQLTAKAGVMDTKTVSRLAKPTSTRHVPVGGEGRESKAAAAKGVARGLLKDSAGNPHDLNLRALLAHMLERAGIDPHEAMYEGRIPNRLASVLLRDGLRELEAHGLKADFTTYGKNDARSNQDDAVLFKRTYGDKEVGVTWRDLKREANTQATVDTPRTLIDAQYAELAERIKNYGRADAERTEHLKGEPRMQDVSRTLEVDEAKDRAHSDDAAAKEGVSDFTPTYAGEEDARIRSLFRDLKNDNAGEATLFDKSTGVRGDMEEASRQFEEFAKDRKRVLEEAKAETDPAVRKEMLKASNAKIKELQAKVEALTGSKEGLTEKAMDKQLGARNPDPVREGFTELVPKTPAPKDIGDAPKRNMKTEVVRAVDRRAAAAVGAKENVARELAKEAERVAKEQADARRAAKDAEVDEPVEPAKPVDATQAVVDKFNDPKQNTTPLEAIKLLKGMDDAAKQKLIDALPKVTEAKAVGAKFLLNKLKDEGFTKTGESTLSDTPFSKETGAERTPDEAFEQVKRALSVETKRMVGDTFGFELTNEKGYAGKVDVAAKKLMVSFVDAKDLLGATRHETWHVVEEMLKGCGVEGKRILNAVYQHTDTPLMRKYLEARLSETPGAIDQLYNGVNAQRDRAAFAFQFFMRDGNMPLHSETRGFFQKMKTWFTNLIRLTPAGNKAENFFKHVVDGGFLRDKDNAPALLRALGETKTDQMKHSVSEVMKPMSEALGTLITGTSQRVEKLGVQGYSKIREAYEGKDGKAGYHYEVQRYHQKFGNAFDNVLHGLNVDEMRAAMKGQAFGEAQAAFERYFVNDETGFTKVGLKRLYDRTSSFSQDMISQNYKEFLNDLIQHGGLPADKAGDAQLIAQKIADNGCFYDPEVNLFEKSPAIKAKWETKDPSEQVGRAIYNGVRMAERRKAFGKNDEKLKQWREEGDKQADAAGRTLIRKFESAYEGTLGNDMSPGVKKVMSALIVANNIRILPLSMVTQLIMDPVQLAFRKNDFSGVIDPLFRGIKELPRAFDKINSGWQKDQWERFAEQVGSTASDTLSTTLSQMHTGFKMSGLAGKVNDAFFKYTFQDQLNRTMTIAATKHAVEFLLEHAENSRKRLGAEDKLGGVTVGLRSDRFLSHLGLKASDIVKTADGTLDIRGSNGDRVERAICQYVNEAMAHPDAGSNPLMMNDQRFALISQMKRFQFAHSRYVLKRGFDEYKLGNPAGAIATALAVPWALAGYGIRDTLNPMADTSYKADWGYSDYLLDGFDRIGGAGKYQIGVDIEKSLAHGGTGVDSFLGPTGELFGRITKGAQNGNMLEALVMGVPGAPLFMPD